jgi:hypothetical protein
MGDFMKVTKLIREYVEEQVSKVYDTKENPYTEQAEIDRQKLKDFGEELRNQQRESIEKFLSENELFDNHWDGFRPKTVCTNVPCFSYCFTQAIIDEKKWKEENNKAKKAKIRDIILALELGANRQELQDMIEKLLNENKGDQA